MDSATDTDSELSRELEIGNVCVDGDKTDEPFSLPLLDVLTGRAFITGKSGSGKSNSASVIIEEILDRELPLLIIDTDGEYWGLREEYEILHVGASEECDLQVGPEHAEKLAELALGERVPMIVDISGYIDEDRADELVAGVAQALFQKAQSEQFPFPIFVEEVHEYIPQKGGRGEVGDVLVQIGKRGRKQGLGLVGMSQRPADVLKDFITQCDWLVWHRLTWNNDTKTVSRILGSSYAEQIEDHEDGRAFVMADFLEEVTTVQVRRKRTYDAGQRPGLEDHERPTLKGISDDIAEELDEISEETARRQDRIAELEEQLDAREARIEELEQEVETARQVGDAADEITTALVDGLTEANGQEVATTVETELVEVHEQQEARIRELEEEVEDLQDELTEARQALAEKDERIAELEEYEQAVANLDEIKEASRRLSDALGLSEGDVVPTDRAQERLSQKDEEIQAKQEQIAELEARVEELTEQTASEDDDLLSHKVVTEAVEVAKSEGDLADEHYDRVLRLVETSEKPQSAGDLANMVEISESSVRRVLEGLADTAVLKRDGKRPRRYEVNEDGLQTRIKAFRKQSEVV